MFSGIGFPVAVVFSFFRFPTVCTTVFSVFDRFFRFSDRIHDRFSVFTRFFLFYSVFTGHFFTMSVFTGAIRLHAARSSAGISGPQRESGVLGGSLGVPGRASGSPWGTPGV